MNYSKEQITERIENLGGTVNENVTKAYFTFDENVSDENGEEITLPDAIAIEGQMMDLGFEGALIGTRFNDGDTTGIYFNI